MVELCMVRHAESLGNRDGSGSDTPLTPEGRGQASALARELAEVAFDRVYCSPLVRARETLALARPGAAITIEPRLREHVTPSEHFVDITRLRPDQMKALLTKTKTSSPRVVPLSAKKSGLTTPALLLDCGVSPELEQVLVLDDPSTLRGTVVALEDRRPLAGVALTLSPQGGSAVSNRAGQFSFTELPEGTYSLLATARGRVEALVKGLVDLHHGTIEAKSAGEGCGSEFIVTLPLDRTVPEEE